MYESRHRTRTMTMTRLDVVHGSSSVLLDSTQLRLCKMRARVRIVSCRKRGPCTILPPKCAWRERASESESEVRGQRHDNPRTSVASDRPFGSVHVAPMYFLCGEVGKKKKRGFAPSCSVRDHVRRCDRVFVCVVCCHISPSNSSVSLANLVAELQPWRNFTAAQVFHIHMSQM